MHPFLHSLLLLLFTLTLHPCSAFSASPARHERREGYSIISILVLDLNNDGIHLSPASGKGSVYWDIDLDGYAEATSWIDGNDAILVIDKNEDGKVNNHSELFGNKIDDGFAILTTYDLNHDHQITAKDPVWKKLRLWQDKNTDGFSQKDELSTLNDNHIKSISLITSPFPKPINSNQRISKISSFKIETKSSDSISLKLYNILPVFDNTNTIYNKDYVLDIRSLYLPTLRGFGTLPNLTIAMSNDKDLLEMVQELHVIGFTNFFSPEINVEEKFENILYRWANVHTITIDSRGPNINARQLAFLENFIGDPFVQTGAGGTTNPLPAAAQIVKGIYKATFQNLFSHFTIQTHGNLLFVNKVSYHPQLGIIKPVPELNHDTLEILKNKAKTVPSEYTHKIWERYIRIINFDNGIPKIRPEDIKQLSSAISDTSPNITFHTILETVKNTTGAVDPSEAVSAKITMSKNDTLENLGFITLTFITVLLLIVLIRKQRTHHLKK